MDYFLIDFENQSNDSIKDLYGVKKNDEVIVFYSNQCKNIALDVISRISAINIRFYAQKVITGNKNSLDFQLSSYLGYLIGKNGNNAKYHIISQDKDYDCLCEYWKERGISVDKISLNEPIKATKAKKSKIKKDELATIEEINILLDEDDMPNEVLKVFNQYKTRVSINNAIVKVVNDTKKAGLIYQKLKPLLKAKNKS